MNLDTSLSIATSGLASINAQYAVLAQNVANASTPGYAVEVRLVGLKRGWAFSTPQPRFRPTRRCSRR